MRILRKIFKWFLIIFFILYAGCHIFYNYFFKRKAPALTTTVFSRGIEWTAFKWATGENSDRDAILIPVKVDTISTVFNLQFDLGIPRTLITSLDNGNPYLKKFRSKNKYENLPLYLGNNVKHLFNEKQHLDYHLDSLKDFQVTDSGDRIKIGDAGFDYIKGRIFICDFINARYALTDEMPRDFESRISWMDSRKVVADKWPVHIPIKINGRQRAFQYDNGSSRFTLLTSKSYWDDLTREGAGGRDSIQLSSWGVFHYYVGAKPVQKIEMLNGEDLSAKKIYYGMRFSTVVMALWNHFEGVEGIIGNEYFRDKVLVIDAKNNRIGFWK